MRNMIRSVLIGLFIYGLCVVQSHASAEIVDKLTSKIGDLKVVPYVSISSTLDRVRSESQEKNTRWKKDYTEKTRAYYTALANVTNTDSQLKQHITILKAAYETDKENNDKIANLEKEISNQEGVYSKTKDILNNELEKNSFQVVVCVHTKYSNDVTKREVLETLEKAAKEEALKYIEEYRNHMVKEIIEKQSNAQFDSSIVHPFKGKVSAESLGAVDGYDFEGSKQAIYAVFMAEVSQAKDGASYDGTAVNTEEIKGIDKISRYILDKRNIDEFIFSESKLETTLDAIERAKNHNSRIYKDFEDFIMSGENQINDLKYKIDNMKILLSGYKNERDRHKDVVTSAIENDIAKVCEEISGKKTIAMEQLKVATAHGTKSSDSDLLHFVKYKEASINVDDSANSIAKKLIKEITDGMVENMEERYISRVTTIDDKELIYKNLYNNIKKSGEIVSAEGVIRTSRKENDENFFGIGILYKVRPTVEIDYKTGDALAIDSDCLNSSKAKAFARPEKTKEAIKEENNKTESSEANSTASL